MLPISICVYHSSQPSCLSFNIHLTTDNMFSHNPDIFMYFSISDLSRKRQNLKLNLLQFYLCFVGAINYIKLTVVAKSIMQNPEERPGLHGLYIMVLSILYRVGRSGAIGELWMWLISLYKYELITWPQWCYYDPLFVFWAEYSFFSIIFLGTKDTVILFQGFTWCIQSGVVFVILFFVINDTANFWGEFVS